jgi:hypothetical protein
LGYPTKHLLVMHNLKVKFKVNSYLLLFTET